MDASTVASALPDVFAESDRFLTQIHIQRPGKMFFVTAHTINGGRFYSEPFCNSTAAENYFHEIEGLVRYFGGGCVEMLYISEYDYDVLAISRI